MEPRQPFGLSLISSPTSSSSSSSFGFSFKSQSPKYHVRLKDGVEGLKSSVRKTRSGLWKGTAVGSMMKNSILTLLNMNNVSGRILSKHVKDIQFGIYFATIQRIAMVDEDLEVMTCWRKWRLGFLMAVCFCVFLQLPSLEGLASTGSRPLDCLNLTNYYKGTEGLQGTALKLKLHEIVDHHFALRYNQVWSALKILDAAEDANSRISSEVYD